jgi:hypothetical protein
MSSVSRFARALSIAVCCILLAGFGVCGAFGTVTGVIGKISGNNGPEDLSGLLLGCGLSGLAIAFVCGWNLVQLWRKSPSSEP